MTSPSQHRVAALSPLPPAGRNPALGAHWDRHRDKEKIGGANNTDAQLSQLTRHCDYLIVLLFNCFSCISSGQVCSCSPSDPSVVSRSPRPSPSSLLTQTQNPHKQTRHSAAQHAVMLHFLFTLSNAQPREHTNEELGLQIILFVWSTYLSRTCDKR